MILLPMLGSKNNTPPPHVIPEGAYYLQELTQAELDYGKTQSDYLVLDFDVDIIYNSLYTASVPLAYPLRLPDGCTFDSYNATINCFPDVSGMKTFVTPVTGVLYDAAHNTLLDHHVVFHQSSSDEVTFICGKIIGDKYKRDFVDPDEQWNEGTYFVQFTDGCTNVKFSSTESEGFMGDTISASGYGKNLLFWNGADGNPITEDGTTGVYYTPMLTLSPLYDTIAIYGGVGFTRFVILTNAKFHFYDVSDTLISSVDALYLQVITIPAGAVKVKMSNEFPSGQGPSYLNCQITQSPAENMIIENSKFYDPHRGSISNVNSKTIIRNCRFEKTANYITKPEFPDTTKYAINPEDNVSNSIVIEDCVFKHQFHSILIVNTLYFKVTGCTFISNSHNFYMYYVRNQFGISSEISFCNFNGGGTSSYSHPNNGREVINVFNNTFLNAEVSTSTEMKYYNNTLTGGLLNGGTGTFIDNTATGCAKNYGDWRGMKNNVFANFYTNGYIEAGADNYAIVPANDFKNIPFQINTGGVFLHNGGKYFYDNASILYNCSKNETTYKVFHDAEITGLKFNQETFTGAVPDLGAFYFYNCEIDMGIAATMFAINNNETGNNRPNKIFLKKCTITTSTSKLLVSESFSGKITEFVTDNCTISPNVILPSIATTGHVPNRCRYIRVYGTGSDFDADTLDFRAIEIYEFDSTTDIALGKQVKVNGVTDISGITDGIGATTNITTNGELTYIEIDLGEIKDVERVIVKRVVGRTYYGSKVIYAETADKDAEVMISNDTDYVEVSEGLEVEF